MILIFDIPTQGSGHLLIEAVLESKLPYLLLVRNEAITVAGWPPDLRNKVSMHVCEPFDTETILAYLKTLAIPCFTGVICALDALMDTAAQVAQAYSLPFASPEAISCWTDKWLSRQCLAAAGVPVPAFRLIQAIDDDFFSTWTHYPAVVKPRFGSGSLGVERVNDAHAMRRFFQRNKQPFTANEWLVEALLPGPIFSVEGYVWNDACCFLGISDRTWGLQPRFVEEGLNFPVLQGTALSKELNDLAQQAITCTNYSYGFFHIELVIMQGRPYVIELNPRYGGPVANMISLAFCCNFYQAYIQLCLGHSPQFGIPLRGASSYYVFSHRQGIWQGFNPSIFLKYPNLRYLYWNTKLQIGDRIGPVYTLRDNIMLVYFDAETTEIAHATARAFLSEVPIYLLVDSSTSYPLIPRVRNRILQWFRTIKCLLFFRTGCILFGFMFQ